VSGDDWFWLGGMLAQSAMLFVCSYQIFKAKRIIERLTKALAEATVLMSQMQYTNCKLLAERDAWRALSSNDNLDSFDELPAEVRACMREALLNLLQHLKQMEH